MNPAAECVSGEYEVVGRTIYRCENGKSIKVESCATGIIYENNVPKCVKLTSEVGGDFQEEIPPFLSFNYSTLMTWIVIGVVGIVLGSGASYFIFKYRKTRKK